jgi:hypothetical protein
MEEAQFGSSLDPPKKVPIFVWERAGDACACIRQQEEQLMQPDQRRKDRSFLVRQN